MSRTLDKKNKRYFDEVLTLYGELGFFQKGFRDFPFNRFFGNTLSDKHGRELFQNFNSLQSYISAHSKIAPLTLEGLDFLFRIYSVILLALFAINMTHLALVRLAPNFTVVWNLIRRLVGPIVSLSKHRRE